MFVKKKVVLHIDDVHELCPEDQMIKSGCSNYGALRYSPIKYLQNMIGSNNNSGGCCLVLQDN